MAADPGFLLQALPHGVLAVMVCLVYFIEHAIYIRCNHGVDAWNVPLQATRKHSDPIVGPELNGGCTLLHFGATTCLLHVLADLSQGVLSVKEFM